MKTCYAIDVYTEGCWSEHAVTEPLSRSELAVLLVNYSLNTPGVPYRARHFDQTVCTVTPLPGGGLSLSRNFPQEIPR